CLEAFGLNPRGILEGDFEPAVIVQCILLAMAGLAGLHFGALSMLTIAGPSRMNTGHRDGPSPWSCRTVGIAMLLVSVIPALLVAKAQMATVYESGYVALYQEDQPTGIGGGLNILGAFLGPGALFLLAGSRQRILGTNVSLL